MNLDAWHVSILVMTGIVLAELVVHAVLKLSGRSIDQSGEGYVARRVRRGILLAGLTTIAVAFAAVFVAVRLLSPSETDEVVNWANLFLGFVAAALAVQTYQESRGDRAGRSSSNAAGNAVASNDKVAAGPNGAPPAESERQQPT